ncbi:hypothetical protein NDA14_005599 [Ustilago hordei]|uniref:Related to calpain-like protease PalBory n=1 Tax=Ustilago hordei TaxID=120017 RepID=I2FZN3_USTHO|nr:uncharacterized protein UHO2_03070 [Ustilago hordei]KAJ1045245.1 hypothetical protein NDA10_006645 [Ustilago hordei]KAJ1599268.1 hypothetical protein NDA14_005599 [Ustilago hordei]UTT91431.1 hypothetical protein NDA17_002454 [Ustilago hordei]CCF52376.1 related to calpain-like protease PalBory [Ustilago hordei]SYW83842.1 related to calpain-like protease PalBory [Ustilago hordei]
MSAPNTRSEWDSKLKHAQDQAQRATKAELARNYAEAFQLYVRAGQLFVWLLGNFPTSNGSRSAGSPRVEAESSTSDALFGAATPAQTRERLKQMATKVMARAEKIKSTRKDLRPVERDALSQEEQSSILVASSLVNGQRYPVWTPPTSSATAHTTSQITQPALSPGQLRRRAIYKRASLISSDTFDKRLRGSDIVQDIVTDCSFVAALEVAAEYDRRCGGHLATSALYPQDSQGRILPSQDGQYRVKLHINGAPRTVLIDDYLPHYPSAPAEKTDTSKADASQPQTECLMCATSRTGQAIWPALLEKAYLKVMGGYDFVGSNGSIDLYALTGWLPEHIFLRHAGFQREKTWHRFLSAWRAGKCMATVGTGKAPAPSGGTDKDVRQEDQGLSTITLESGLISSHNYAILDVLECNSRRYLKLMNPWRTAAGVRPAIAIPEYEEKRIYAESSSETLNAQLESLSLDAKDAQDAMSPTFTVTWDDLCSHFDSLFLNWDPKLFDNNVTVHSSWRGSSASSASTPGFKQPDPHFRLTVTVPANQQSHSEPSNDPAAEVWLLLNRHITNTRPSDHSSGEQLEVSTKASAEYIALHVFEDDQHASQGGNPSAISALPLRKAKHMGAYVDGTHCLVRLKPSSLSRQKADPQSGGQQQQQRRSFTVVVSRRDERDSLQKPTSAGTNADQKGNKDVNYTLSVLSRYQMELSELRTRLPFCETISGSWTTRSAGGNATLASFLCNPQYTLLVPPEGGEVQVQLVLESADRRIPVQVLLTYPGPGSGRVTHLTQGDVVLSSGMYHHGLALCSTSRPGSANTGLRPGTYTLIASTFEADTHTDFQLGVESTRPLTLKPIAQEGAGMFHRRLTSCWRRGVSAFGSPANRDYLGNPSWRLTIERPGLNSLVGRIRSSTSGVRPYINLALFSETREGLKEVASSGSYTDLACGAAMDSVKLQPGVYRVVASTYQPETEAEFSVDLYTAAKIDVSPL